jgi:hypothetical protein
MEFYSKATIGLVYNQWLFTKKSVQRAEIFNPACSMTLRAQLQIVADNEVVADRYNLNNQWSLLIGNIMFQRILDKDLHDGNYCTLARYVTDIKLMSSAFWNLVHNEDVILNKVKFRLQRDKDFCPCSAKRTVNL